jgi:NTP pyrophosphatase (non-canonical NTP hydrolase)
MKETASFAMSEFAVTQWADKVGILKYGTVEGQIKKLYEEVDELRDAWIDSNRTELRDALADVMIVLVMISLLTDNDLRQCFHEGAQVVTKRKGKMTPEGIFVKNVG